MHEIVVNDLILLQEATQLEMQDVPASGKGFTTKQEMVYLTTPWNKGMLPNYAPIVQDQGVTKTCLSWTLSPQQSSITATSRTCWL